MVYSLAASAADPPGMPVLKIACCSASAPCLTLTAWIVCAELYTAITQASIVHHCYDMVNGVMFYTDPPQASTGACSTATYRLVCGITMATSCSLKQPSAFQNGSNQNSALTECGCMMASYTLCHCQTNATQPSQPRQQSLKPCKSSALTP